MTESPPDGPKLQQLNLLQTEDYALIRSKRRTLSIVIREGRVEVRAPLKAPQHWIQSFVREKADWIQRQLLLEQQRHAQRPVIATGRHFPYLGKDRLIRTRHDRPRRVELSPDHLTLHTDDAAVGILQSLLFRWLQDRARNHMTCRTLEIARSLGVEHRLKTVTFRKTRSKWGHCRQDGTIQYNWLIMLAPPEVVEYLIVHETSHLRHMDHSQRFWSTVAGLCPEYRRLRRWLRDNGHRLWPIPP